MNPLKIIAITLMLCGTLFPSTIYVDSSATGDADGSSWTDAYTTLQPALDAASSGNQIWVAAGTYFPTQKVGGETDRFRTFQMKNNVAIYGGFAGIENPADFDLDSRDFTTNETILSGDLYQDDYVHFTTVSYYQNIDENCLHVFYNPASLNLDRTSILDGFTIIGGNYDRKKEYGAGGSAIHNEGASPTFRNLVIKNNKNRCEFDSVNFIASYSSGGGAVYNIASSGPRFENIYFNNNEARAMHNEYSYPEVINTTIKNTGQTLSDGIPGYNGMGFYNFKSSAILNNIVIDSISSEHGGTAILEQHASSVITNLTIKYCKVSGGWGLLTITDTSTTQLDHITVTQNFNYLSSSIVIGNGSSPIFTNLEMTDNQGTGESSGIVVMGKGTAAEFNNVLVADNWTVNSPSGACVAVFDSAHAVFNNTTCVNNLKKIPYTDSIGPGTFVISEGSIAEINNCIFWGTALGFASYNNEDTLILNLNNVNNCCIDTTLNIKDDYYINTMNYIAQDPTNIFLNPQFADSTRDPIHPYALTSISPCIDAGNNEWSSQNFDIRGVGSPRKVNGNTGETGTIDIGAYEFQPSTDISLPVTLSSFNVIGRGENNLIIWITESEVNSMGFNIYRSDKESGHYKKINQEIIQGAGNSSTQQQYKFIDNTIMEGTRYWYKLEDIAYNGESKMYGPVSFNLLQSSLVKDYHLYPNYPNPFNPITHIKYDLPENCYVNIVIYNVQGKRVKILISQAQKAGSYQLTWNGTNDTGHIVSSGVYFLKISSDNYTHTQKMFFVR